MDTTDSADDDNLETFSILWLDGSINNDENREAQKQLRMMINHIKTFENPIDLLRCIQHSSAIDRIVLITSGRLSQQVIPKVHLQAQVVSIYIYCMNKTYHEKQCQQYNKVGELL